MSSSVPKRILQDHNQLPFQDEPYELRISSYAKEAPRSGSTDGTGMIIEQLPSSVARVVVRLPKVGLSWSFDMSLLPPLLVKEELAEMSEAERDEHPIKVAQTRLNALGFPCGAVDGKLGPRTREALARFQGKDALAAAPAESGHEQLADSVLSKLDAKFEGVA